ncbi:cyanuric acid amidohydrolase [Oceanicola granulosus HTCC2516]|uniref:Cyclic amide hydrolase n=1 Tax=Oceanicola granulosus (strain ATCC BAA-861 / DSM 15982 / KCTC 12143 / HTCC2516) TaxID=314256 RepID=Q2CH72_OCEGH|nr:ring-opening amidohydrolase [Oceanicola granulosus]EAR51939.1 cyanuric acid amidohydrolase [Oceanicola granulosus HTCC2516]
MRADVIRFDLPDPGDVSALAGAIDAGRVDPGRIVAIIGKTHGNGLVNDYTRGYLTQSLLKLLAARTGEAEAGLQARIPMVFSGGVEGVLSPHFIVFAVHDDEDAPTEPGLAVATAMTPPLGPEDLGRQRQIDLTAAAVEEAMARADIHSPDDVHFVQVKGPAFAQADLAGAADGLASDDPGKLMGFCRAASAIGVARALGEVPAAEANEAAVLRDFSVRSNVASCSAGLEVSCNEVIVIGMAPGWSGPLAIAHAPMADALDVAAVHHALAGVGLAAAPQLAAGDAARLRAVFVKGEAARSGLIRGRGHTMLNDGDIDQQRHIRAALGAVVAATLGETQLFVSGGAEHQGPAGGGLVAVIAERT